MRALAKLDGRPFPRCPILPTLTAATGVDLGDVAVWLGLVAPRGTAPAMIDKLNAEVVKVLNDPEVKAKADAVGLFAATSTPAESQASSAPRPRAGPRS